MIDFEYLFKKWGMTPNGILHLGANTAQEAETYKKLGVEEVIWVEAIPEVFKDMKAHLEKVDCMKGATCINACVGEQEGKEVEFNVSNNESQSSSYLQLSHHLEIHPEVFYVRSFKTNLQRVDNLLKDFSFEGKWLLNMDLQGAELPAVRGMGTMLNKFDYVYSEINKKEVYRDCTLVEDLDKYLTQFGFYRAETGTWVGDSWTDGLYLRII